jgi:hypothetical protein
MSRLHWLCVAALWAACPAYAQDSDGVLTIPESESAEETPVDVPPAPAPRTSVKSPEKLAEQPAVTVEDVEPIPPAPESNTAVLQGLNKVTGKTSVLAATLGTVERFGTMEIIARRCWKAPPEERPENAVLLEMRELKTGAEPTQVFLGWMFSSSPAVSALEHPVYDITVLRCEARDTLEEEAPPAEKTDKDAAKKAEPKPDAKADEKPAKKPAAKTAPR